MIVKDQNWLMNPKRRQNHLGTFSAALAVLITSSLVVLTNGSLASVANASQIRSTPKFETRSAGDSVCMTDLDRLSAAIRMPNPVRLERRFSLAGATFAPIPSSFKPVVTPLKTWQDFHERLQSTATYKIFLTRMHQDNPPGTNPAFEPQFVWLVIARHVAFLPSPAPGTNYPRPPCAFGFSYWAVNATSGKSIYGAGG